MMVKANVEALGTMVDNNHKKLLNVCHDLAEELEKYGFIRGNIILELRVTIDDKNFGGKVARENSFKFSW